MNPDGFCYVLLSAVYLTTDARMYSLRSDPRFGELQRRRVGLDAAFVGGDDQPDGGTHGGRSVIVRAEGGGVKQRPTRPQGRERPCRSGRGFSRAA